MGYLLVIKEIHMQAFKLDEFEEYINSQNKSSRVYIGCDSARIRKKGKWFVDYITVVVVHIDAAHGCRVFGEIKREPDTNEKLSKPFNRMMNEAYKAVEMYQRVEDILILADLDFDPEVHLDINPNKDYGSSCAVQAATGYVYAMCNVVPMVKPDALAASYAADRYTQSSNRAKRKLFKLIGDEAA
jgi:predicted RNase H-related nuclease YkuK (DUF458 family)